MIPSAALEEFKVIMFEDYRVEMNEVKATKLVEDYLAALEAVLTVPKEQLTKPVREEQNND